ncbi:MAG: pilus assembly protein TadG-related protein [Acidobacteria bacterium]|nr:pilus assembly protein TadG-related protein [Acidobacteriota bacterium]
MSIQLLVILVPVIFGLMGFALDLGRLYLIRGELNQAASEIALAAAGKLIGTSNSLSDAQSVVDNVVLEQSHAPKYNFGSIALGESTGLLSSTVNSLGFYSTLTAALGDDSAGGSDADGTTARHVSVSITADAPLLFWSLLPGGEERKAMIAAQAVAGISAPLCEACAIVPIAVAPINAEDTTDFGFTAATTYTLAYQCTVDPNNPQSTPVAIAGTAQVVNYLVLNYYDDSSTLDENQQLYRIGAQGLLPSTDETKACVKIQDQNNPPVVWASLTPRMCTAGALPGVTALACGMYTRVDTTVPTSCSSITDIDTLSGAYQPDTDVTATEDYTAYTGNTRRVMTVAVVDALSSSGSMNVLGFRQFLIDTLQDGTYNDPGDRNNRLVGLYIGSVVPIRQGRFSSPDGACQITAGPGKVVLHQ